MILFTQNQNFVQNMEQSKLIQIKNASPSYVKNEEVSATNLKKIKPLSLKTPSLIENKVLLTNKTLNTKIKGKSHPRYQF